MARTSVRVWVRFMFMVRARPRAWSVARDRFRIWVRFQSMARSCARNRARAKVRVRGRTLYKD